MPDIPILRSKPRVTEVYLQNLAYILELNWKNLENLEYVVYLIWKIQNYFSMYCGRTRKVQRICIVFSVAQGKRQNVFNKVQCHWRFILEIIIVPHQFQTYQQ